MISLYFSMALASSLVFLSLLFGSSLYASLNFLKACTLHRHRTTFSTLLYPSYASVSRYPAYPFSEILLGSLLILLNGNHKAQSVLHVCWNGRPTCRMWMYLVFLLHSIPVFLFHLHG